MKFDKHQKAPLLLIVFLLALSSTFRCQKEEMEGEGNKSGYEEATPKTLDIPGHFPEVDVPKDNPTTKEGVALGRELYYDPLLSEGGPLQGNACADCHQQEYGFTIPGAANSTPVLPHVNLAWNDRFLWNGKVQGELEAIMAFEVEEFFRTDVQKLRQDPDYPDLFGKAFGEKGVTLEKTEKALAQFLRTLISGNSKFDRYLQGQTSLTPSEANGYNIFNSEKGDCFHCHSPPLFTDNKMHNIGLDSIPTGEDRGYFLITGDSSDLGKFKTPTLRNVAMRSNYMHDGRFSTLMEVVEHYNNGVHQSTTLDPIMKKPGKKGGLGLSSQEKEDLVAFLKALSDSSFTKDPSFSP